MHFINALSLSALKPCGYPINHSNPAGSCRIGLSLLMSIDNESKVKCVRGREDAGAVCGIKGRLLTSSLTESAE